MKWQLATSPPFKLCKRRCKIGKLCDTTGVHPQQSAQGQFQMMRKMIWLKLRKYLIFVRYQVSVDRNRHFPQKVLCRLFVVFISCCSHQKKRRRIEKEITGKPHQNETNPKDCEYSCAWPGKTFSNVKIHSISAHQNRLSTYVLLISVEEERKRRKKEKKEREKEAT